MYGGPHGREHVLLYADCTDFGLDDQPGRLHALTGVPSPAHINVLHIGIHRLGPYTSLGRVGLDVIVDTRDRAHASAVLALVRENGFPAEELLDTGPARSEH